MKALQFIGDDRCAVNELDIPRIGDDEVLLASRSVGICHSRHRAPRRPLHHPVRVPVIPGHEWAAEVVRVGSRRQEPRAWATGWLASA